MEIYASCPSCGNVFATNCDKCEQFKSGLRKLVEELKEVEGNPVKDDWENGMITAVRDFRKKLEKLLEW